MSTDFQNFLPLDLPPHTGPGPLTNGLSNVSSAKMNGNNNANNNNSFYISDVSVMSSLSNAASFSTAPGGSTSTTQQQPKVYDYNEAFPALEAALPSLTPTQYRQENAWSATKLPKYRSSVVTQVFHLPSEERQFRDGQEHGFGERGGSEQQRCNEIMQQTECKIELCESKDHSLTIVVTGKRSAVEEARKLIVQELQTQASREIRIPKDHHRVIIGREGRNLQKLETDTDCRIMIPNRDMPSEVIKICGPREGIDRAIHQIQIISDEQSKMAQEHLFVPRIYYPWIKGPENARLQSIAERTGARVNIPPPSAKSEVIIVTGEKEGVHQAIKEIRQIFEDKQRKCQTVDIQVEKTQHRYIIGPHRSGLMEILRQTDVSVEVPDENSESKTVTLRGEPERLGQALPMVYQMANSVLCDKVECPQWLHKFIIGPRGSNLKKIVGDSPKVQVKFEENMIYLDGAPDEVRKAKATISDLALQLQKELLFDVLHIHPNYHRHIIGRAGANISKIKEETGVLVNIPDEKTNSDEVRLEGNKEGVGRAREMIMEIVNRMENEKTRDIVIEQRFHRQIIGAKGEAIQELRKRFVGVNISFPDPSKKSDVVTLRGPKDDVDRCHKHLTQMVKQLQDSSYQLKLPIYKEFLKVIIGKGGHNIKQIREETDTRIDIPDQNADTDVVTITGKKPNVEKARDMLQKIQNEQASIVTLDLTIPYKLHSSLLGGSGRLIQSIQEECGNVNIKFPPEAAKSDKVTIRGPKDDAEKAKTLLSHLAKDKELASFQAEVKAKPEQFRFLIGRGGATIKKVRDAFPMVRILFPRQQDVDQETIHLVGKKEEVQEVKQKLEGIITALDKIEEEKIEVDPKWHRYFVARRGAVLQEIQENCGGVIISFPRQGSESSTVVLKGARDCVEEAKRRIQETVDDLECEVTITVVIPQRYHRVLLSNKGSQVQEICEACKVQVKFPDRGDREQSGKQQSVEGGEGDHVQDTDSVLVTGRPERCEEARARLEALIPITQVIPCPFDMHGRLIGAQGKDIRKIMDECDVNVTIPNREERRDEIIVTGSREHVERAVECIRQRLQEEQERSFEVRVEVPASFLPKLIGTRGKVINAFREQFDVRITVPKPESATPNEIIITGLEEKAHKAKEEILRRVQEAASMFTQEITLDCRIHSRIIGLKGRNINKIMDDYNVELRFPRNNDPDPNLVVVTGPTEDCVYDCIDHLRNMEEEYLQDVIDKQAYMHPSRREDTHGSAARQDGVMFKNAPWQSQAPDMGNLEEFPSMGNGAAESEPATMSVPTMSARPTAYTPPSWGPRRY